MPIYEYRREDGSTFEVIQKFSDEPLEVDPETGKKVQRVYRAPAIHFKGSGFHNTDYGSKRRPKAGGDDSSSAAKAETPSSSSSDKSTDTAKSAGSSTSSDSSSSKAAAAS